MKIKIRIWTMSKQYSIFADDQTKEFTIGLHNIKKGVEDFVREAIQIVKDWPDRLENLEVMDGISYKIAYDNGMTTRELVGMNQVPKNFVELMSLIEKKDPDTAEDAVREEQERKFFKYLKSLGINWR